MKKYLFGLVSLSVFAAWMTFGGVASAQIEDKSSVNSLAISPNIVISQFMQSSVLFHLLGFELCPFLFP